MTINSRDPATGTIKAHEPTELSRKTVEVAAGYGLPYPMIATLVGIGSETTLRRYYAEELASGKARAVFQVAKTLFDRATAGKDLGAAIFYLKSQAGFREKHVLDDPGAQKTLVELLALSGIDDRQKEPDAYVTPARETMQ